MTFYTGDAFPRWKGNLFVGSLSYAHLERMTFNDKGEPTGGREHLLTELKQRIRDVRQGPDGNLYLLTDAAYGALLKVEPVD
jgi:glucose/arabinose dehydrogenase